jgi:colanic acid biosynthesis glycosyl transferase WcaI
VRVQLWSYNYDPEPTGIGPVSTTLARALRDRGHQIAVVAAHPHYPAPEWGARAAPYRETREGIPVLRLPLWIGRASARERYRQELSFMSALAIAAPLLPAADISIVVSPSFPALLPALVTHRLRRRPWVLWLHDILPDGATATGLVADGAVLRASRGLERAAYRHADHIVVLSRAFTENLSAKGVPREKIELIYDPATRQPGGGPPADRRPSSLRLLCMGNIGYSQGLAPLVAAFDRSALPGERVRLVVTGTGVAAPDAAAQVRTERVEMVGLVAEERLERELRQADVGLVTQHYEGGEFNIPSKLMNYMMYGLPILAAVNPTGEVAALIRESGAGWVVDSRIPDELPREVARLLGRPEEVRERGRTARRYALEHFTVDRFADRFDLALRHTLARSA